MTVLNWSRRDFWRSNPWFIQSQLDIHRRANDPDEIDKMKNEAAKASAPRASLNDLRAMGLA